MVAMSLVGEVPCTKRSHVWREQEGSCAVRSHVWRGEGWCQWACTVRCNASWVMVTSEPPVDRMMDRHDRKHYLPQTSLADGKNGLHGYINESARTRNGFIAHDDTVPFQTGQ